MVERNLQERYIHIFPQQKNIAIIFCQSNLQ